MGLLTADVTPLGVVISGDSQPVELRESAYAVEPATGQHRRPCLTAYGGEGFTAAVGFVGTEQIAGRRTIEWLKDFFASNPGLSLDSFCDRAVEALSAEWERVGCETVLWLFICGATSDHHPFFRAIRNCGPDMDENLLYTQVGPSFVWHDDLANHLSTYGEEGETDFETLTRALALFETASCCLLSRSSMASPKFSGVCSQEVFPDSLLSARSLTTPRSSRCALSS
jgi:hypothetical protein